MKLNEKIIRLREHYELTQANMAELINVSRYTVVQWERGSAFPKEKHLRKICNVFRLNMRKLIFDSEELVLKPRKRKRRKGEIEVCGEIVLNVLFRHCGDEEYVKASLKEYTVGMLQEEISLMTVAEEEQVAFSQERTYFYIGRGTLIQPAKKTPRELRREKRAEKKKKHKGIFRFFR